MGNNELFELALLGGPVERRYRRQRPDVERMPWGTLVNTKLAPKCRQQARHFWMRSTFQEHRTAAACAATIEALIAARAPLDLIAVGSRFIVDELAHVELCACVLTELGGGIPLMHDPAALYPRPAQEQKALMRAADLVVRVFCVGEAFSVPMAQHAANAAEHPLIHAVMRQIAKDEAAHGAFGWTFFDWALDLLTSDDRARLASAARHAIDSLKTSWANSSPGSSGPTLGWLTATEFRKHAQQVIEEDVCEPLRVRGLLSGSA